MAPAQVQPDAYWLRDLRPLPIQVAPLPGELTMSFLRRLAHANRTDTGLLVRHLATDHLHGMQHRHDLVLNRAARQRLAILSGYPETLLRKVLSTRQPVFRDNEPQPERQWDALGTGLSEIMRPCTRCAARRGARIPALVRLSHDELPICVQHYRTLVSFRDEHPRQGRPLGHLAPPREQPLDETPEIVAAARRYRTLRRRRPDTVGPALTTASQIISGWRTWQHRRGEPDPILIRWRERSDLLPRTDDQVIRYPETIALATLFARIPQLLLTPRGNPGDPTPMMFFLSAAHHLHHPSPGQLLRPQHPLFRWAGADDLPR